MKVAFVAFFGTSCLVSADQNKLLKRGGTVRGAQNNEDITEDVAFWTRMLQMGSMPDRVSNDDRLLVGHILIASSHFSTYFQLQQW